MKLQHQLTRFCLLVLFCTLLFTPAYAQKKGKRKKNKQSKVSQISDKDDIRVQKLFFDGIAAKMKGDIENAEAAYKEALKIAPNNDAVMHELAKIYVEQQDREQALLYAESAAKLDQENKWYQFLYAELLASSNQFEAAAKVYENLVNLEPNNVEYYFDWGYMLIYAQQYAEAIKVFDKLEQKVGIIDDVVIQKQKLYVKLEKIDKAASELKKLIENDPSETRYYLLLGDLYKANNRDAEAFKVYEEMSANAPDNPAAHLALSDYYLSQGDKTKYFDELKQAFSSPDLPLGLKAQKLNVFIETQKNDTNSKNQAFELVEMVVKAHPNEAISHIIHGDMLNAYKQPEQALTAYKKAMNIDSNHFEVWYQMMVITYDLKQLDELTTISKEAITLFPNQAMPYYFNGLAHSLLDKHDSAIKSLKRGAMISVDNPDLAAEMHSLLGNSYNTIKEYEKSDKSFDKSLKINPNNVGVLNNYAYYLSLRNDKLDKAAEMSKKSNSLQPNNASYEDTYGWILFQQNNYDEAKNWLEKALKNGGSKNTVIIEHYGDILFKLNLINDAIENWEKAKSLGSTSPNLDKKIKDKKLY